MSQPQITAEWLEGKCLKLPTHQAHFYTVDRYEFTGIVSINTHEQCHICMLVEGDEIEVLAGDATTSFCYAETFVIPANIKKYELNYRGNKKAYVVVAYVKEDCC